MNNIGSAGIATISLLTSFLVIGATTSSVMFGASDDLGIDAGEIANDALNEIYQKSGIDGIQQLSISCGDPGFIGHAVANSDLRASLENEILTWLESKEDRLLFVARSFVSACANIDKGWLKNVTEQSGSWSKDKFTNFLLGLPFRRV